MYIVENVKTRFAIYRHRFDSTIKYTVMFVYEYHKGSAIIHSTTRKNIKNVPSITIEYSPCVTNALRPLSFDVYSILCDT